MKVDIASRMGKHNASLRLLLATEAFGMGVDVADIRRVVHIGVPHTLCCKRSRALCCVSAYK